MIPFGQPTFVLGGALAFAILATTVVAVIARRRRHSTRFIPLVALPIALLIVGCAVISTRLRWNVTASMPIGLYWVTATPPVLTRGMVVAVCAPPTAAKQGRERGYLGAGPCADNTEPLLKTVAGVAGDLVDESPDGVLVNGRLLPNSRALHADRAGRTLAPTFGLHLVLPPGTIWAYADHPRSWDSRYWGAVPVRNVLSQMLPLAVVRYGSAP
jgi:conjugative transfer signal peptidase TraF